MNHPAVVQVHGSSFADSSLDECRPSLHDYLQRAFGARFNDPKETV